MAFFDWDGNGKKDFVDDFMEYSIFEESMTEEEGNHYRHSNGKKSNPVAGLAVITSIIGPAALCYALGLEEGPTAGILYFVLMVTGLIYSYKRFK